MATPITHIRKTVKTEEDIQAEKLQDVQKSIAENDEAFKKTIDLVAELHDSGLLEAAESMLKAKAKITEIALGQLTRKEVTNIVNNMMGAAAVLTEIDPEQTKKMLASVSAGLNEAKENQDQKVSMFSMMKALKDPDVNRAIGFGLSFLKGMGKGLK